MSDLILILALLGLCLKWSVLSHKLAQKWKLSWFVSLSFTPASSKPSRLADVRKQISPNFTFIYIWQKLWIFFLKRYLVTPTNLVTPGRSAIVSLWFCVSLAYHCDYPPKWIHKNGLKELFDILHFSFSKIFFSRVQSFSFLIGWCPKGTPRAGPERGLKARWGCLPSQPMEGEVWRHRWLVSVNWSIF